MSEQEWPEFRRWYELTMEEQRVYDDDDADDRLLDIIDVERNPLEHVMVARVPQTLQQIAMLAVIELRYAEKRRDDSKPGCRLLELGMMRNESGGWAQGAYLIESILKLALARNLLPGVEIHGEGGNV